ncbi:MAG TPA: hypothetical protein VMT87_00560 [Vicinamibacteria bacterium]|nr:hypothetical protein [Vicinamibacteria bacterium]
MITVCAWCKRFIKADPTDRLLISHGMCVGCQTVARTRGGRVPTLVVPVRYADLVPALEKLLGDTGIPVVLDRRLNERRRAADGAPGENRRRGPDRRETVSPQLN